MAAEVTREMILDYMRSKGGVVKNVDLVRHFRKYLQLSNQRAKDQARDQFKARVNEVAYIKADSKGEKYLYLKTEHSSGQSATDNRGSTHISVSKRDSTHSLLSKRDSAFSILSETSSSRSPAHHTSSSSRPTGGSPAHPAGSSTQQYSTTGQPSYKSGQPSYKSGQSSKSNASDSAPLSLLGDSLLSDSTLSSFLTGTSALGGGSSTTPTATPTTGSGSGGDSSFASDIFGRIGGSFWGDSGGASLSTASVTFPEEKPTSREPPPDHTPSAPPTSSSGTRSTPRHSASSKVGTSQVAGGGASDVTLHSYKPLSSPPRHPSPPSPSHPTKKAPYPPPTSWAAPHPPERNLNYTQTYPSSSGTTSGSVFSPPPRASATEGSSLLSDLTSDLGSFGELGSLFDSFGDFSLSKKKDTSTQPSSRAMASSGDQTGLLTSSSGSSDRSNVTLVAETEPSPSSPPPSSSQTHSRWSPAKTSTAGTFTSVRQTPPPGAPGSPMRVPRSPRSAGLAAEPPLSHRHGSTERQGSQDGSPRIHIQRVDSSQSESISNGMASPPHQTGGDMRGRPVSSGLPPLPPSAILGSTSDPRRVSAATSNGGVGVVLRPQDRAARDRAQSSVRRSRNLDRTTNLDSLTRASIMMTPPSVRRSFHQAPGPGGSGMYARPAPSSSGEDLSQCPEGGDPDSSLSAPSDEYELDPLEKEWMLACASGDLDALLSLIMRDDTLINRKGFLHGTALHWAAKLGRCDIMSALVINGAFPNIKSGGFTALHLACQGGYDNAIAMLVRDHGANVNVRDNSGRKPVDMLNYSCPESIRIMLTERQRGNRTVHHSSEYLPSFSQPRNRLGSLTNTWASMPNSLESSDEKRKRVSPKMSKRTFSFRNKHKLTSPGHDKKERPRSHVPETYDA